MAAVALSLLEAARPPVEAQDDLDWLCNEAPSEMGERSSMGAMLERASLEHILLEEDPAFMHGKRPGRYGKSLSAMPWEEWVEDVKHPGGGYFRRIWGEKPKQTTNAACIEPGLRQMFATEMYRNVREVLALVPARLRALLLVHHTPRVYGQKMRQVFGANVRIAHLSEAARTAFRGIEDNESTVGAWLEGLALRFSEGKGKAGEKGIIEATRKESARDLAAGYAAFEEARAMLPFGRRYPFMSKHRHARRLSAAGP